MEIFRAMAEYGHEELVFWYDRASGLRAVVAIHDTTLGPALGGLRVWNYPSEEAMVEDALRLSRGMTAKNSAMGLDLGGGKAVIWADRAAYGEALFRAFGRLVESLAGRYITAEDVGVGPAEMALVARETRFVGGLPEGSGDPSPATALGVLEGMKAALAHLGGNGLSGLTVAVQGLGHVGSLLAHMLADQGARLVVTDLDHEAGRRVAEETGARWVDPGAIYDEPCDIFAPCALGAVLNADTVERLRCRMVAGSANNQLATPADGRRLWERGILYVPDFVVNGGGVINVAEEFARGGYRQERAYARVRRIGQQVRDILTLAEREGIPPFEAADRFAEERRQRLGAVRRSFIPRPPA
ncbi:branched-chain amino acid dehydrogenase [Candidatus Hydrogenisulfobacillus filiaventi]|uniref:Branched-chain amino acid dehydrogenase n=1 Tax=Candidatus Hydrogenisulfobacillus filiaventi TaxID=2707344 RepID=A0A6F8ZGS6_9FIRM|nr:branched-chain amino acid dehydrogenase [Candidatus Hydrogenisulfobacillus filiaventi]